MRWNVGRKGTTEMKRERSEKVVHGMEVRRAQCVEGEMKERERERGDGWERER